MKLYTIMGGVDGAGKSSLLGALESLRTDLGMIVDENADGCEYIAEGISFTQETTLAGSRPLRMIREAKEAGYHVRLFYVGISSAEESIRRIENRVAKGGHDIPREDVQRRFAERGETLARVLDHVDEAIFYDNENGFAVVAEYRNGELIPRGSYCPDWLKELQRHLAEK